MSTSIIPMYSTKKFTEIFPKYDTFKTAYLALPLTLNCAITIDNLEVLYYLLYARYGNSPIANYDENMFKYKLFGIIWQYGPTWQKRLEIQAKIRGLSDAELLKGAKAIYNHAFNPGEIASEGASATTSQPELQYVNDQNVTNYTKSKMDAYMQQWDLLSTDVTNEFLNRFDGLFKKFVMPGTYLFEEDDNND